MQKVVGVPSSSYFVTVFVFKDTTLRRGLDTQELSLHGLG